MYRRQPSGDRAVVLSKVTVVRDPDAALAAVTSPGFDPKGEAVLEGAPGGGNPSNPLAAPPAGRATFRWEGDQRVRVTVNTPVAAVVLVKNAYDPLWRATVDGRSTLVMPADSAFQAVRVPPGRHVVDLTFDDPWIGVGLAGSGVAVATMLGAAFVLKRRLSGARSG